jgi:hypothetical protein
MTAGQRTGDGLLIPATLEARMNEYIALRLAEQRLAELRQEASRETLIRELQRGRSRRRWRHVIAVFTLAPDRRRTRDDRIDRWSSPAETVVR